jgi:hypothetical protein
MPGRKFGGLARVNHKTFFVHFLSLMAQIKYKEMLCEDVVCGREFGDAQFI